MAAPSWAEWNGSETARRGVIAIHVAVGLALGSAIAVLAPFDLAFAAATGGSPLRRAVALPALALAGLSFAGRVGLQVPATRLRHPIAAPLAVAAVVALAIVAVDCRLFTGVLPASYRELFAGVGLAQRLLLFMLRAFNENILYRLFLTSLLVWLLSRIWRGGGARPAPAAYWAAITLAQGINVAINVVLPASGPVTPLDLLYDGVRYVLPGVVWGYLYWRHGFVTAEIASVGCHPFLQPPLGYFLG
jgi:hypothetical protein